MNNDKINYARSMLLGRAEARDDIPRTTCDLYLSMKVHDNWMTVAETKLPLLALGFVYRSFRRNRWLIPWLGWLGPLAALKRALG